MVSTTTYDVRTVDRVGNVLPVADSGTGGVCLALAADRTASKAGGSQIAFIPLGLGGELRPRRGDRGSAEPGGRELTGAEVREGSASSGRGSSTSHLMTDFARVAGAVDGFRHLRSCGTPVPGSAPSATAP
ncbi:hypothetical protein [uncultured Pseudokineococcus sp.]|uniref:hypothetical protein n=1 Tax=uncultured Pseudokineococcus sp. TaxID=1642928 RepID=UPI00260A44E5|nr:hypothetical protein [uncultured Pseudokineococcus sp.]